MRFALLPSLLVLIACGSSHAPDASSEDGGGRGPDGATPRDGGMPADAPTGVDGPTGIDGPPIPDCSTFTEAECWGVPYCAPHYDDDCCPSCTPGKGCADCVDWAFYACGPRESLCSPAADPCGLAVCEPPDCSMANPTGRGSCTIAGCIEALTIECSGCPIECHLVTPVSCVATCEIVEPPCPDGMRAEADGDCYTGFCIPREICGG